MTVRWIWICDGPDCDLRQEVEGGRSSDAIREQKVSMSHVDLWRGHLCDPCTKKAADKIRAALTTGKPTP